MSAEMDWQIQSGPCLVCGATDYPLSMGGPGICPACDCYPPEKRVGQLAAEKQALLAENERLREALRELASWQPHIESALAHFHPQHVAAIQAARALAAVPEERP